MLGFIFYCFITMSSTSKYEENTASGQPLGVREERNRMEFKKRNLQQQNSTHQNNSRSYNWRESKEGQNSNGNNTSKNQNAKSGNNKKIFQNSNNNNSSNNNRRKKQYKRNDNKKEILQREKGDLLPMPSSQREIVPKARAVMFIDDLRNLEEDGVYPLRKKSIRFPRAKFFCRLCEYHCDTVEISLKHIHESRHTQLRETKFLERALVAMLPPVQAQFDALTELMENISIEYGITDEEISQRQEIKEELENELKNVIKDAALNMTGSTLNRFALKSSDLNLDVVSTGGTGKVAAGILAIKKIIEANPDKYIEPVNDLSSAYPCLSFTHQKYGVRVVVGVHSATSTSLNRLLSYYCLLDQRVKVLVTAFKYWAKLCNIDNQNEGALSSHCFPLMVVHYLQQISPPVLPVLHELFENKDPDYNLTSEDLGAWTSENKQSTGELWLNLFKYYAIDFKTSLHVVNIRCSEPYVRLESKWGKKMAIEDPFQPKRNQTHTVSSYLVFDYIASRFKQTYRYFVIPQMSYGPLFKKLEHEIVPLFKAISGDTFTCELDIERHWGKNKPSPENEDEDEDEDFPEDEEDNLEEDLRSKEDGENNLSDLMHDLEISDISNQASSSPMEETKINESNAENGANASSVESAEEKQISFIDIKELVETLGKLSSEEATCFLNQVTKDMLHYNFNQRNFTEGKKLPLYCTACQKSGHTKSTCVEHELPPLKPLPQLRRSYLETISIMFLQLKNECSPKQDEIRHRDYIVRELQNYIQDFYPNAVLKLFGSSANGFGFGNSDLDICLTFNNFPTGKDLDHVSVIEDLAKKLKRFRECRHVLAITTAKVPIVKFTLNRAQLDADLSLYNTLALQNTKLLSTYTAIDQRVKVVGYTMKYFAKLCDVGDASRGSLSSYAYILMILHYLQQCKPAVVPVLQELYDHSKEPPEHIIDGWNAWFFEDLTTLSKVWKDYGKNTDSVGELWIGMLRYYTEVFNWKENVITIRQYEPLTKLEKLWTTKCIAIEDPFDLSHNLGTGLSRKMNAFILTSFIKGREVFGCGVERPPFGYHSLGAFLFDKRLLTDGSPPNDRGCRWCGRIGHMVKECPRKQQKKDNKETPSRKNNEKRGIRNQSPQQKAAPIPVPAPKTPSDVTESIVGKSPDVEKREISPIVHSPLHGSSTPTSSVQHVPVPSPMGNHGSKGTEISPSMLFQLANWATGGTIRLPGSPHITNAGYIGPSSAPPGFAANMKPSSPLLAKGPLVTPLSRSLTSGEADLGRLFPNHEQIKNGQQIWQNMQMPHPQQVQMPHPQQAQMTHSQQAQIPPPQQAQIQSTQQAQLPLSQQPQISHPQQIPIQYNQHAQMHHQLQNQQIVLQQQKLLQYQQQQQQLQQLQMQSNSHPQNKTQPPIPPLSLDGNAFINHVMAHVTQGGGGQNVPPIRPNWGMPCAPLPSGLNSNFSPAVQRGPNPLAAMQLQQNRQCVPDGHLRNSYPLDLKEAMNDSPDMLLKNCSLPSSETSAFQSQLFGSVTHAMSNPGVTSLSPSNQILTGPGLSVPFPKVTGNGDADML